MSSSNSRVPEGIEAMPRVLELFEFYGPAYTWFAVVTAMLASFATLLTATVINVAIPEIMGAFGIGQDEAQWLSTAFLASGSVTMLLMAWCVDAFGMRQTYVWSVLVFLFGSILGGFAHNPETLILARIIQGASAGVLGPIAMTLNYQIFPVARRGFAMGIFGIGVVLAPALGPTVGGFLIDNYDWRYVFFLAIPFSLISIPLAMMFMPVREEAGPRPSFDWTGAILSSIFLVSLLTGLSDGQREGWQSDYIVLLFATAVISATLFVWWENRIEKPMLDLELFTNPGFVAASLVTLVIGVGLYGSTYLLPLFVQGLQGITPTASGLLMLPAGLVMAAMFPVAGMLSDSFQPRFVIIAGLLLFGLSNWFMRVVDLETPFMRLLVWAIVGRIGLALLFPGLNAAALSSLPLHLLSQGSGAINFLRQLGGAFGVNMLSIFLARRTAQFSDQLATTQAPSPDTLVVLKHLNEMLAVQGYAFMEQLILSMGYLSRTVYGQASALAFREGFYLVAIVFFLAIIPTWFMKVDRCQSPDPDWRA
ncbi:MAG: DHA2 family efflux MFS transporter permease subunit [Pseudomonadales bacterium]